MDKKLEQCNYNEATHIVTKGGTIKEIQYKASGDKWFKSVTTDGAEYGPFNVRKYLKPTNERS